AEPALHAAVAGDVAVVEAIGRAAAAEERRLDAAAADAGIAPVGPGWAAPDAARVGGDETAGRARRRVPGGRYGLRSRPGPGHGPGGCDVGFASDSSSPPRDMTDPCACA